MASEAVDGSRLYSKVKRPSPYKPCGTEGKSVHSNLGLQIALQFDKRATRGDIRSIWRRKIRQYGD